jgi:ParB family chromosome partitioning protein
MPRRTGLGKGLEALIPGGEQPGEGYGVNQVSIDSILPNPSQPRTSIGSDDLSELSASIREHGILQPLVVSDGPLPGQYFLVAGERRLRAARQAGLETVPIFIRQVTPQEQLELALVENLQRSDLTPLETAEAYHDLSEKFNLSHEEIAQRVGKNRVSITNTIRLLKLPETVKNALAEGKISEGHARALLMLNTIPAQLAALQTILMQELNVRQTEELVRRLSGQRTTPILKPQPSPEISAIEERLRTSLETKVELRHGKKGGSIIIHYYSDEELDHLINRLSNNL